MKDVLNTILIVIALGFVFIIVRRISQIRMVNAYKQIINELKAKQAHDEDSAVPLEGLDRLSIRLMKNHRPKIIEQLLIGKVLGATEDHRFYLNKDPDELEKMFNH